MSAGTVEIKEIPERDFDGWDTFVAASPNGSIYNTARYLDILCAATKAKFRIIGAYDDGKLAAGVALFQRSVWAGHYVQNRLLLYYNGIVIGPRIGVGAVEGTKVATNNLIAPILTHLDSLKYGRLRLHCRSDSSAADSEFGEASSYLPSSRWATSSTQTYVVDLESPDKIWSAFDKNVRRLIRRAESAQMTVSSDDDFDSFYAMHLETHLRKGAWLYLERDRFRSYIAKLLSAGLAALYHVRLPSGEAVATQLVLLGSHPISHTVSAGAKGAWMNQGSNPLLRWKAFESLSNSGFKGNDLTDAASNSVSRFKSQLGGRLIKNTVIYRPDAAKFRLHQRIADGAEWTSAKYRAVLRRIPGIGASGEVSEGSNG